MLDQLLLKIAAADNELNHKSFDDNFWGDFLLK